LREDEVLPNLEAIIMHFNEKGERKNRMAARIKYLIRKEGIDTFKAEVAKIRATLAPRSFQAGSRGPRAAGTPTPGPSEGRGSIRLAAPEHWPQKQKGFRTHDQADPGRFDWRQFHALADIAPSTARTTCAPSNDQNLLLPGCARKKWPSLRRLVAAGLSDPGPDLVGDVTSCPEPTPATWARELARPRRQADGGHGPGQGRQPRPGRHPHQDLGLPQLLRAAPRGHPGLFGNVRKWEAATPPISRC